jgi:hypothetical protein
MEPDLRTSEASEVETFILRLIPDRILTYSSPRICLMSVDFHLPREMRRNGTRLRNGMGT